MDSTFDVCLSGKRLKLEKLQRALTSGASTDNADKLEKGPKSREEPTAKSHWQMCNVKVATTFVMYWLVFGLYVTHNVASYGQVYFASTLYALVLVLTPPILIVFELDATARQHILVFNVAVTYLFFVTDAGEGQTGSLSVLMYACAFYITAWNLFKSHSLSLYTAIGVLVLFSIPTTFLLRYFTASNDLVYDLALIFLTYVACACTSTESHTLSLFNLKTAF